MALMLAGLALYVAPAIRWRAFLTDNASAFAGVVLAGAAAPLLAALLQPVWQLDALAGATFSAVVVVLETIGYDVSADPVFRVIGADGFRISIAPVCSGVEGMALVSIFVTVYLALFRDQLRIRRALWLYPIGIAASAAFNVLRIAVLLVIGVEGNPELAVGGFHSHAGWMMFLVVALGLVAAAQTVPWFRVVPDAAAWPAARGPRAGSPPLTRDRDVASLLPFAVFMATALVASTATQSPALYYPLRVAAVAATMLLFWRVYLSMRWSATLAAPLVGVAVGAMWLLVPVAPAAAPPYAPLEGGWQVTWLVARGLGTILLVPNPGGDGLSVLPGTQVATRPVMGLDGPVGPRGDRPLRGAARPLGRGVRRGTSFLLAASAQRTHHRRHRRARGGERADLRRGAGAGASGDHLTRVPAWPDGRRLAGHAHGYRRSGMDADAVSSTCAPASSGWWERRRARLEGHISTQGRPAARVRS